MNILFRTRGNHRTASRSTAGIFNACNRCGVGITLLLALLLLLAHHTGARAQGDGCTDACCRVERIVLSTGYDHTRDTAYRPGDADPFWRIVQDDNQANGRVPRDAWVLESRGAPWAAPLPGSQWIGATPTPWNSFLGYTHYERRFCVCGNDSTTLTFSLKILVDDSANVFLDGRYITSAPRPGSKTPTERTFTRRVVGGEHSLLVAVHNAPGQHSGLAIQGTVTGDRLIAMRCCGTETVPPGAHSACDTTRIALGTDTTWSLIVEHDSANWVCSRSITQPNGAWGSQPGAGWIGPSYNGNSSATANSFGYRKCFRVLCAGSYAVKLSAMSDDSSAIKIDDHLLLTIGGYGFQRPKQYSGVLTLDSGCHCISGHVLDAGGVVTGLNVRLELQGAGLENPACSECSKCGYGLAGVEPPATGAGPARALECVPNPVTGTSAVRYTLAHAADVRLELYSADGRLVAVLAEGRFGAGNYAVDLERTRFAAGAYRAVLHVGESVASTPVVMQ